MFGLTLRGLFVITTLVAIGVALVGVKDLVVVETEDAILITTREGSQDVGRVVAELKQSGRNDLT